MSDVIAPLQFDIEMIRVERVRLSIIDRILCNRGPMLFDDLYSQVRRDRDGQQHFNTAKLLGDFITNRTNIFESQEERVADRSTLLIANRSQGYRLLIIELVDRIRTLPSFDCIGWLQDRLHQHHHGTGTLSMSIMLTSVALFADDSSMPFDNVQAIRAFLVAHPTIFSISDHVVELAASSYKMPSLFDKSVLPGSGKYDDRSVRLTTNARVIKIFTAKNQTAIFGIVSGRCNRQMIHAERHRIDRRSRSVFDQLSVNDVVRVTVYRCYNFKLPWRAERVEKITLPQRHLSGNSDVSMASANNHQALLQTSLILTETSELINVSSDSSNVDDKLKYAEIRNILQSQQHSTAADVSPTRALSEASWGTRSTSAASIDEKMIEPNRYSISSDRSSSSPSHNKRRRRHSPCPTDNKSVAAVEHERYQNSQRSFIDTVNIMPIANGESPTTGTMSDLVLIQAQSIRKSAEIMDTFYQSLSAQRIRAEDERKRESEVLKKFKAKHDVEVHALHVTKIDLLIEQQRLLDAIVELNKSKETIEQRYRQQMEENKRLIADRDDELQKLKATNVEIINEVKQLRLKAYDDEKKIEQMSSKVSTTMMQLIEAENKSLKETVNRQTIELKSMKAENVNLRADVQQKMDKILKCKFLPITLNNISVNSIEHNMQTVAVTSISQSSTELFIENNNVEQVIDNVFNDKKRVDRELSNVYKDDKVLTIRKVELESKLTEIIKHNLKLMGDIDIREAVINGHIAEVEQYKLQINEMKTTIDKIAIDNNEYKRNIQIMTTDHDVTIKELRRKIVNADKELYRLNNTIETLKLELRDRIDEIKTMKEQLEQTRRINTTTPLTVIGASTTPEVEIPKPILKKQRLSLADTRVSISALTKSSDHQSPIKTTTSPDTSGSIIRSHRTITESRRIDDQQDSIVCSKCKQLEVYLKNEKRVNDIMGKTITEQSEKLKTLTTIELELSKWNNGSSKFFAEIAKYYSNFATKYISESDRVAVNDSAPDSSSMSPTIGLEQSKSHDLPGYERLQQIPARIFELCESSYHCFNNKLEKYQADAVERANELNEITQVLLNAQTELDIFRSAALVPKVECGIQVELLTDQSNLINNLNTMITQLQQKNTELLKLNKIKQEPTNDHSKCEERLKSQADIFADKFRMMEDAKIEVELHRNQCIQQIQAMQYRNYNMTYHMSNLVGQPYQLSPGDGHVYRAHPSNIQLSSQMHNVVPSPPPPLTTTMMMMTRGVTLPTYPATGPEPSMQR